jgi:hypothetical protein
MELTTAAVEKITGTGLHRGQRTPPPEPRHELDKGVTVEGAFYVFDLVDALAREYGHMTITAALAESAGTVAVLQDLADLGCITSFENLPPEPQDAGEPATAVPAR